MAFRRHLALVWAFIVVAGLSGAASLACSDDDAVGSPTPVTTPASTPEPTAGVAPTGPVTFPVIAGRARGNIDVEAFMPADIQVRVGDRIEWTAHGFEGHTVTFGDEDDVLASIGPYLVPRPDLPAEMMFNPALSLPSAAQGPVADDTTFINSGFFGVPSEQTYSLTFDEEGLYTYLCLVHPFTMTGTVSVEPEGAPVDAPDAVAARGEALFEAHAGELEVLAVEAREGATVAPGPGSATTRYVQAGLITDHGQVAVYTPGKLEIAAGDTVIFQNDDRNFHNVIFKGDDEELPPGINILPAENGRLNFSLAQESAVAVDPPPEGFDATTFLSSGSMGVLQPRITWTLRFDTPGTYHYACTIHTLAGMVGVIEVRAP